MSSSQSNTDQDPTDLESQGKSTLTMALCAFIVAVIIGAVVYFYPSHSKATSTEKRVLMPVVHEAATPASLKFSPTEQVTTSMTPVAKSTPTAPAKPQIKAAPTPTAQPVKQKQEEEPARTVSPSTYQLTENIPDYHPGDILKVEMSEPKIAKKTGKEIGIIPISRTMIVKSCDAKRFHLYESPTGQYADWVSEMDWFWGNKSDESGQFKVRDAKTKEVLACGNFQVSFIHLPGRAAARPTLLRGWFDYTKTFAKGRRTMKVELAKRAEAGLPTTAANKP